VDVAVTAERATASVLAGLAGLHAAWGLGSPFPFTTQSELADAVAGTTKLPRPATCFAVASALATGSILVLDPAPLPGTVRRAGLLTMSGVLAVRAVLGWSGHTDKMCPGSNSTRFRRLDRRVYSPLCAAIAAGGLLALRDDTRRLDRGRRRRA
jgi:hypothetical protein